MEKDNVIELEVHEEDTRTVKEAIEDIVDVLEQTLEQKPPYMMSITNHEGTKTFEVTKADYLVNGIEWAIDKLSALPEE